MISAEEAAVKLLMCTLLLDARHASYKIHSIFGTLWHLVRSSQTGFTPLVLSIFTARYTVQKYAITCLFCL